MNRVELEAAFEQGLITWQEAFERLHAMAKPWHTAAWARRREEVLQKECAVCGSTETPLQIQHVWHPRSFRHLCDVAAEELRPLYANEHPFTPPALAPFRADRVRIKSEVRKCCPQCGSPALYFQSSKQLWVCRSTAGSRAPTGAFKRKCGHEFSEPVVRDYFARSADEQIATARARHFAPVESARIDWEKQFRKEWADRIQHRATQLSFADHARYMEMRPGDVKTCCKRCAFREDRIRFLIAGS